MKDVRSTIEAMTALLEDDSVAEIMVDGPDRVYFERKGKMEDIVAGGTGSGKTTLTRMIAELIPEEERLVVVGDTGLTRLLRIRHKRLVCLEVPVIMSAASSGTSVSGLREPDASELLRLAARMRPDRIVYGELTGPDVLEVLRLTNMGHEGLVATMHATSPRDALSRLETMATIAEPGLTLPAIRGQVAAGLDLIVHLERLEDGSRKVLSIAEVQGLKGDNVVLQELLTWQKTGVGEDGRFTGVFKATGAVPSFAPALAAAGLTFPEGMFETHVY